MANHVQSPGEHNQESPVKRIDYYAQHNPWKVPKWVGLTLGSVFAVVAVTALVLIVYLTRSAHADAPPAMAAAALAAPTAQPQVVTPPPVQPQTAQPSVSALSPKHAKASKVAKSKVKAANNLAAARQNRAAILARHDSHEKRKQKDDLDRMLGL
jgi:hypothetical protein